METQRVWNKFKSTGGGDSRSENVLPVLECPWIAMWLGGYGPWKIKWTKWNERETWHSNICLA